MDRTKHTTGDAKMITKTTVNMAKRRGIHLEVYQDESETMVEFCGFDQDGQPYDEYNALYRLTSDGLHWVGSCFQDSEEWPNWIESDRHLRQLLPAIAEEV
jgi:hypothetical protein